MKLIDCHALREEMLTRAKLELTKIYAFTGKQLKLVVISVGDDPASQVYVRNKLKTCDSCGILCDHVKLPEDSDYTNVAKAIYQAVYDEETTSVMLQLPLPKHLKEYERKLLNLIPFEKDADGLSNASVGRLWNDEPCIAPATAQGILELLDDDLTGLNICTINRSKLVGQPLIKLLMDRNATVTVCHSKTANLQEHIDNADIIITAIGKPKYFKSGFKNEQMIIDVSINRDENGKLCGDVDPSCFEDVDCIITKVPGSIGLLTCSQLVLNLVKAYKLQNGELYGN